MAIDEFDRKILKELQKDARLKNTELSQRVGLSPTPCWRRVKRMEDAGIIENYVTIVNSNALGLSVCVFVNVTLGKHGEDSVKKFAEMVTLIPEVLDCYLMTGDSDYLLRVVVSGVEDFERFLNERLFPLDSIDHVKSSFALKQYKNAKSLPI